MPQICVRVEFGLFIQRSQEASDGDVGKLAGNMSKIAFILLCHKDPEAVVAQANRLTAAGNYVSIHFDARAPQADYAQIQQALADDDHVTYPIKRLRCGWGDWSLVEASLNALRAAVTAFDHATHFYLISGDCMPIKSATYAHRVLDDRNIDYIESVDFYTSDWIMTGMKEDRLHYRHYFNERQNKTLFYASLNLQRTLGLKRDVPADLEIMIGSQWWCLRRSTCEAILDFCMSRADVMRFFRRTWIPDETFFQTLVSHLVPRNEIENRTPTFLMFTDYGLPVTFYNDHFNLLLSQQALFARKISPEALALKAELGEIWASQKDDFPISGDGRRLFSFLTRRGREGRRFASRFWEREGSLGRDRELIILTCKKWHVAKRMARRAAETLGIQSVYFLYDEMGDELPNLGGIQTTLLKRNRHRRALMKMLYDYYDTDKMILCLDPANFELLLDFYSDTANVSTLQLNCAFDDQYLEGHANRVGLVGDKTPRETLDALLPTLRYDFAYERDRIREADFPRVYQIAESMDTEARANVLRDVFRCKPDAAEKIANTPHLFAG